MKTDVPKDEVNDLVEATEAPLEDGAVEQQPLAEDQVQALRAQAAKAEEYRDQLLRTAADLDNYKKRAAREKQEAIKFANESLLGKLIPVLDNFEMALAAVSSAQTGVEGASTGSLQQGVSMIQQQLKQVLSDAGLEEVNAAGQPFDPNCHEAVAQRESAEAPEGHVLQQLRKGYKLRERLLRPATVVVAKAPAK